MEVIFKLIEIDEKFFIRSDIQFSVSYNWISIAFEGKKTIIDAKRMNTFLLYAFFKRTKSNMEFVYENLYESNMDLYGKFQTFTLQFEVIHLLIALE